MDNNQIKFLGACVIFCCSIFAISVGFLTNVDTDRYAADGIELIPGILGVVVAAIIGIPALRKLRSSKDK